MDFKKFLIQLEQVISEFLFLTSYFDTKENSKTFDFDAIFVRWKRDIFNRFRNLAIHMHWTNSSELILHNQILLDVLFLSEYHFELRYRFGIEPQLNHKDFIENTNKLYEEYMKFFNSFPFSKSSDIKDFEEAFDEWKQKTKVKIPKEVSFDLLWEKSSKKLIENTPLFNIIYKDVYLIQIKSPSEQNTTDTNED